MLSQSLAASIMALMHHHAGLTTLSQQEQDGHWQAVAAALQTDAETRLSMSVTQQRLARVRQENGKVSSGRPPSQWYEVGVRGMWDAKVLGVTEALALATKELEEYPGNGKPPSKASITVMLSNNGAWTRHLVTDIGEWDLHIKKCSPPETLPEEAEPSKSQRKTSSKKRAK